MIRSADTDFVYTFYSIVYSVYTRMIMINVLKVNLQQLETPKSQTASVQPHMMYHLRGMCPISGPMAECLARLIIVIRLLITDDTGTRNNIRHTHSENSAVKTAVRR